MKCTQRVKEWFKLFVCWSLNPVSQNEMLCKELKNCLNCLLTLLVCRCTQCPSSDLVFRLSTRYSVLVSVVNQMVTVANYHSLSEQWCWYNNSCIEIRLITKRRNYKKSVCWCQNTIQIWKWTDPLKICWSQNTIQIWKWTNPLKICWSQNTTIQIWTWTNPLKRLSQLLGDQSK